MACGIELIFLTVLNIMNETSSSPTERLQQVLARIAQASETAKRADHPPRLIAVSKTREAGEIAALFELGVREFGESYLQESVAKIEALNHLPITWHFIGPIQSNKTKPIAEHFQWVHSVSSDKIARRLNDQRPADLPPLKVCIQVNLDAEASKSGIMLSDLPKMVEFVRSQPHLELMGLMCIPSQEHNDAGLLKTFQQLARAAEEQGLSELSMGMSGDLESAIKAGSTMVRVGTALFGPRKTKPQ